jgi:hypothetical protein
MSIAFTTVSVVPLPRYSYSEAPEFPGNDFADDPVDSDPADSFASFDTSSVVPLPRRLSTHIGHTAAPPMAILLRSLSTWWEVYQQLQLHPFNSTFTITWYALTCVPPLHRLLAPLFAALNQIEAGNSTDDLKILGSWRRLPSVLYLSMRCCTFCRMHCVVWERSRDHAFLVLHPWTLVYTIMYEP